MEILEKIKKTAESSKKIVVGLLSLKAKMHPLENSYIQTCTQS